ncbi:MAG: hypothetical protein IT318_23970 [Anaerolineales bacterium]|nr:hypothetical protein [Anaerolineales bacterium]
MADELARNESKELARLETIIQLGLSTFVEVGNALLRIRDGRLYRASHKTFEEYTQERWGMTRRRANQLIGAAETVGNLGTTVPILPDAERQVRPMAQLAAEQQQAAWDEATRRANGQPTAAIVEQVVRDFNYKRDNKSNRAGDAYVPQGYDACQTPPYAIDPLLPFLPMEWTIWEPACGEGLLVEAFYDADRRCLGTDLLTGQNFFEYAPPEPWHCLVTNPPYSIKYEWLERCYRLGRPFALLLPVETLGASRAQTLFKRHGLEVLFLDRRVNFKMPKKGWEGGGAQFPVAWFTWKLELPDQMYFGTLGNGTTFS